MLSADACVCVSQSAVRWPPVLILIIMTQQRIATNLPEELTVYLSKTSAELSAASSLLLTLLTLLFDLGFLLDVVEDLAPSLNIIVNVCSHDVRKTSHTSGTTCKHVVYK